MNAAAAISVAGLLASAQVALACEELYLSPEEQAHQDEFVNKPVRMKADCSFDRGGSWDAVEGEAAFDIGGGRVGQKIQPWDEMLVVQCAERQGVIVIGVPDRNDNNSCGPARYLTPYLPPNGKFRLDAGATYGEFIAYMKQFGMSYAENVSERLDTDHRKDRIDLLCGCRKFYPDLMKGTN